MKNNAMSRGGCFMKVSGQPSRTGAERNYLRACRGGKVALKSNADEAFKV